jgi:hypothetical protein
MRIGVGLGTFVAFGYLLNLLHIPLEYRIFLVLILVGIGVVFFYQYWKHKLLPIKKPTFNINIYTVGMLILFTITFYMYHTGALSYPYLEDDDPWPHATGVKYVALEKSVFATPGAGLRYIDPYPPAYDMVMGILHQTNTSLFWTLKFFNALMVSLSIIFFYYFARQLVSSSRKAFFATGVLFAVPAFMSHFIWAIALTMPLFFVAFYCVERINEDKLWVIPSSLVTMAALTSSASHSVYFGLFLGIYLLVKTLTAKRFLWYEYTGAFSGAALSFSLWWLPMLLKHGAQGIINGIGAQAPTLLGIAGTADRQYYLADFIKATSQNIINNPIGFGSAASLLFCICVVFLFVQNWSTLHTYLKWISISFIAAFSATLLALSYLYIKYTPKRDQPGKVVGSVPFLEFVGDQTFLIVMTGIMLILFITIAFKRWHNLEFGDWWLLVALAWGMFALYAVMAGPFYYKLSPFRAWMLLATPFALLTGEGINLLVSFAKGLTKHIPFVSTAVPVAVLLLVGYSLYASSFVHKFAVNTAQWHPGGFWTSAEELQGYLWLHQNLPFNAKVFTFSNNALINGFDKFFCHWCTEDQSFQRNNFNLSAEETHAWLKQRNYEFIIIDGQTARKFGANETNAKIQALLASGQFNGVFSNNALIIAKVI